MTQVAQSLGVGTPETVRKWCRQGEVDAGRRPGTTSDESAELQRLKRENAELKRANAILRSASALFAAELDRPQLDRAVHRLGRRQPRRGWIKLEDLEAAPRKILAAALGATDGQEPAVGLVARMLHGQRERGPERASDLRFLCGRYWD